MLSIETIQKAMRSPLLNSNRRDDEWSVSFREARSLAHAAYEEQDPTAFALAERMLYAIHTESGFNSPLSELPQIVWGVLMRAKLIQALSSVSEEIPQALESAELAKRLESLIDVAQGHDHSFIDEIAQAGNMRHLTIYSKNWMITAHGFVEQLASLMQHCGGAHRLAVQQNIADEFKGTPHTELRQRYLERIQVNYSPTAALSDPDYLPEAMSVLNFRTGLDMLGDPYYALGSFYTVEAVFSLVSKKLVQALPRFGLNEYDYEMFTLHSTADEDHAAEWLEAIECGSPSPAQRAAVLVGATAQMRIRHRLFDAMRERCRTQS